MVNIKVGGIIYGRDDGKHLGKSLKSMLNQSHPLDHVVYVDDASLDNSVEVAKNCDVDVIQLKSRINRVATPLMSILPNLAMQYLEAIDNYDYLLVSGADILLERHYLQIVLEKASEEDAVLASGIIMGERWRKATPKGAGRIHSLKFWKKYVKAYPFIYGWEAYPVLLARMLGYKTFCTPEALMKALRPTKMVKANWGVGMREFGFLFHAVGIRSMRTLFRYPEETVKMLANYIRVRQLKPYHESLAKWVYYQQLRPGYKFWNIFFQP